MKVKDFIFRTPYSIKGLNPIRVIRNNFGVDENFYLINSNNLETLLLNRYDKDFKERTLEDMKWFLNSNSVAIVNKPYLLNKFLSKDSFSLLRNTFSSVSVLVD